MKEFEVYLSLLRQFYDLYLRYYSELEIEKYKDSETNFDVEYLNGYTQACRDFIDLIYRRLDKNDC